MFYIEVVKVQDNLYDQPFYQVKVNGIVMDTFPNLGTALEYSDLFRLLNEKKSGESNANTRKQ